MTGAATEADVDVSLDGDAALEIADTLKALAAQTKNAAAKAAVVGAHEMLYRQHRELLSRTEVLRGFSNALDKSADERRPLLKRLAAATDAPEGIAGAELLEHVATWCEVIGEYVEQEGDDHAE